MRLGQWLDQANLGLNDPLSSILPGLGMSVQAMQQRGLDPGRRLIEILRERGMSLRADMESLQTGDLVSSFSTLPAQQDGPAPARATPPTKYTPNPVRQPGEPPPGGWNENTIEGWLATHGMSLQTPVGNTYGAFGGIGAGAFEQLLRRAGIDPQTPIREVVGKLGQTADSSPQAFFQSLQPSGGATTPPGSATPPPAGTNMWSFPPVPPLTMPPGTALPVSPTMPTTPPVPTGPSPGPFDAFAALIPGLIQQQQAGISQSQALLSRLAQQATADWDRSQAEGAPLTAAAVKNLQAILDGQRASPALEGLVSSTFDPIEAESQRRLRQTAEEAAAARGFRLTDTPIGQPFLEESRRLTENLAGQRSSALMGLRQGDAQLAGNVRSFQEQIRQQQQQGQFGLAREMASPDYSNLAGTIGGLHQSGQQQAVNQFQAQVQAMLGQQNANLQRTLGIGGLDVQRAGVGLQQQGQSFQQLLAQQQQALQAQTIALNALGTPQQTLGTMQPIFNWLQQQPLQNLTSIMSTLGLGGTPPLTPTGMTQTTNTPSNIGGQLLSTGGQLGAAWLLGI